MSSYVIACAWGCGRYQPWVRTSVRKLYKYSAGSTSHLRSVMRSDSSRVREQVVAPFVPCGLNVVRATHGERGRTSRCAAENVTDGTGPVLSTYIPDWSCNVRRRGSSAVGGSTVHVTS